MKQLDVEVSTPANDSQTCNLQTGNQQRLTGRHVTHGQMSPLCTMVHNTCRWCTTQVGGAKHSPVRLMQCTTQVSQTHMDRQKAMHMSPLCISTGVLKNGPKQGVFYWGIRRAEIGHFQQQWGEWRMSKDCEDYANETPLAWPATEPSEITH